MTVKMYVPFQGQAKPTVGSSGAPISVDANGSANVAEADVLPLLREGWVLQVGQGSGMPIVRRTTHANNANSTLAANALAFGKKVILVVSGGAALTHTTATAALMLAEIPGAKLFDAWSVLILNLNSGNLTVGPGVGVTLKASNGTAANLVMATNKTAELYAQYDGTETITMTHVARGDAV
jgi:hypothetical protein